MSLEEFFAEVVQPGVPDEFCPSQCQMPATWKKEHDNSLAVPEASLIHGQARRVTSQMFGLDVPSDLMSPARSEGAESITGEEVFIS